MPTRGVRSLELITKDLAGGVQLGTSIHDSVSVLAVGGILAHHVSRVEIKGAGGGV